MAKKIDLTGQRFGKWTVLRRNEENDKHGNKLWVCRCECGENRNITTSALKSGNSTNCGCSRKPRADITGQVFGKWTVVKYAERTDKWGAPLWECLCKCGTKREHTTYNLQSGRTKSCGCSKRLSLTGKVFHRLTVTKEHEMRDKKGSVLWECLCECGSVTLVNSDKLVSGNTKSCGCYLVDMMKANVGTSHWSYNPEISDEERLLNRYRLHNINSGTWRNSVYSTDNYTCQSCNRRDHNLNAHHLNSWNAFPEQRFDTANGITLCEDCHKEFHHFNGYGNNTLEQFRDHIACTVGEEHVSEIEETLLSRESEIIGQEVEQQTRELQTT